MEEGIKTGPHHADRCERWRSKRGKAHPYEASADVPKWAEPF